MESTKVSVIIPVYNTYKYLGKCLDSLLGQTLQEIEIIVVDDESSDIIEEVISKYNEKIVYIKNPHRGIGYTRNTGVKKASGEYIAFVDSDDYIEIDMYEKYYNYAVNNDCDLVVGNYFQENKDSVTEIKVPYFNNNSIKNDPSILTKIDYGPCNKMYKRELITKNKIKFEESLKYEDMPFVSSALFYAKNIGHINKAYYHYVVRRGSETTSFKSTNLDIIKVLDIYKNKFYEKYPQEIEYVIVSKLLDYNIQQRNNPNNKEADLFINQTFAYINRYFSNYRKNKYFSKESLIKRIIKNNKIITKIYCRLYSFFRKIVIKWIKN